MVWPLVKERTVEKFIAIDYRQFGCKFNHNPIFQSIYNNGAIKCLKLQ